MMRGEVSKEKPGGGASFKEIRYGYLHCRGKTGRVKGKEKKHEERVAMSCCRFDDFGCSFASWKRFWVGLGFGGLGNLQGSVVCVHRKE